jgi:hypothetical protein
MSYFEFIQNNLLFFYGGLLLAAFIFIFGLTFLQSKAKDNFLFIIKPVLIVLLLGVSYYLINRYSFRHWAPYIPLILTYFVFVTEFSKSRRQTGDIVARMGGFMWDMNSFCRGWSITGRTGSGKTVCAINTLMHQVFFNLPNWGGMAVDEKGNFYETLLGISKYHGQPKKVVSLKVRVNQEEDLKCKFNLLSYPSIPWETYSTIIVDTAKSLGQKSSESFFETQAQIHMGKAMEYISVIGKRVCRLDCFRDYYEGLGRSNTDQNVDHEKTAKFCPLFVSLENVYRLLTTDTHMFQKFNNTLLRGFVNNLERYDHPFSEHEIRSITSLLDHFQGTFLNQPEKQLDGVLGTIRNYLYPFTLPDISEVFCCEENTIDFRQMDDGYVFSVTMPQKYQTARKYVNTIMKLLYYTHAMSRFDLPSAERKKKNMLVFWADEAQGIVTAAEQGMADYTIVDKIREAKCTVVFATQSIASYIPRLTKEKTNVMLLNLSNQVYFTEPDHDSAKTASEQIGKHEVEKRTYSSSQGKGSVNIQKQEEYYVKPSELMQLKQFECVVRHCEKGFRKTVILPRELDNRVAPWYWKTRGLRMISDFLKIIN